ncbi:MAG: glutamine-hydrolyzing carbamoyl-phosphate synthase small subunit [Methanomassiliicoccaceae archaeon]|nr:glutamine-hydrolyzing carbamoyl-phosphate synthase small subunit [Methanomassiliicoccaceae archaeon]
MVRSFLVLEDGTVLEGVSFGYDRTVLGEIVFSTSMSGYQESITDPAHKGQILVSAFPMIGTYGISDDYDISGSARVSGLVVREYCEQPSDMYGGRTLHDYLKEQRVPGISGIDTRDVVGIIRDKGTMGAAIVQNENDIADAVKKLKKFNFEKESLVEQVSVDRIKRIDNGKGISVGIIDCGADRRMIADLSERYDIVVFPYGTKAKDIGSSGVKGLIISGGPGSPEHPDLRTAVKNVKKLSASLPIAGVGLGAQIIARAFGCDIVKLKFGHHGCSQPVKHKDRVHITSQNHMYTVSPDSMRGTGLVMDMVNVNDGTLEGFSHSELPIFGIQFIPMSPKYDAHPYFYDKLDAILGVRR